MKGIYKKFEKGFRGIVILNFVMLGMKEKISENRGIMFASTWLYCRTWKNMRKFQGIRYLIF